MKNRICRYCGKEYPIEYFELANIIKGKEYRRWKCRKCYQADKNVRKKKIKTWFHDLKKTFKCKICGEDKFYMLDLHHRDPKKKDKCLGHAIHGAWGKKRILKEVAKCDVLCSNHHRELHYKETL